jgi:DNA-binding CsgD family transcriptional regulator
MARIPSAEEASASLDPLVYRIHAANDRDADWNEVLELLRERLGARSAALGRHHFSSGQGAILYDAPRDPAFEATCVAYAPRNPWFLSSIEYASGRVMTGEDLLSNRDLVRTDFYRELLRPHGLLHRLCGVVARRGDVVYYVAAHRGEDQEGFGERERSDLKHVLAHISIALENHWRYLQAEDLARAMMRIVEREAHATLLTTADGRILYRNKSLDELSEAATGLRIDGDWVRAGADADNRALREAIAQVIREAQLDREASSRVVTISVPRGAHPCVLTVRPGGRLFAAEAGEFDDLVVLTLRNAHTEHDPRTCPFARQFDFTPAQARVSALVFSGHSLAGTAQLLHVSENTVRSHLKQIFQKTNTHGQMELVHLHARLCTSDS